MLKAMMIVTFLAGGAAAQPAERTAPKPEASEPGGAEHEAAEDKARTKPGAAGKGIRACHEDVEKFCAGVKPGDGRLGACLKKNEKKLSKPCRRWTRHGGKGHVDRAFQELDPAPAPEAAKP